MILEEAARLEALAGELTVMRRSQQHGQSLAHRGQLVNTLLTRARNAWASVAALSKRFGEEQSSSPLFETALTKISEWRSALEGDLGVALTGDFFTGFQASTDKAVRELEQRATGMWQRYIAQRTPEISTEVLTALEDDPRAAVTVVKIRHLAEGLRRLQDRLIPSPEEQDEFDESAAQLRGAWSTLDVANLSEEIVAFLRAANGAQGAPLIAFTQQVREWLEQRGAVNHYAIRPADQ
jgi:hypothetical protein